MNFNQLKQRFESGDYKKIMAEFENELKQWGKLASGRIGTEYPALSPSVPTPIYRRSDIPMSDARFMQFEPHIVRLIKLRPDLYSVLLAKYVYKMPLRNEHDRKSYLARIGVLDLLEINKDKYFSMLESVKTLLFFAMSK